MCPCAMRSGPTRPRSTPGRHRPSRLGLACLVALLLAALPAHAETWSGRLGGGSTVRYQARTALETWEGVAEPRLERLRLDEDDLHDLTLEVRVSTAAFDSGNRFRDRNARLVVFETDTWPEATWRATGVRGDPPLDLPDGARRELVLTGTLDLHGVTRDVAVPVEVRRRGEAVDVEGRFEVSLEEYEMRAPSLFGLRVEDRVDVSLDLRVVLEAP